MQQPRVTLARLQPEGSHHQVTSPTLTAACVPVGASELTLSTSHSTLLLHLGKDVMVIMSTPAPGAAGTDWVQLQVVGTGLADGEGFYFVWCEKMF